MLYSEQVSINQQMFTDLQNKYGVAMNEVGFEDSLVLIVFCSAWKIQGKHPNIGRKSRGKRMKDVTGLKCDISLNRANN